MENFFSSVLSGFSQVVGKLLGHPLDFLAGKSCNTKCQPTWDLFCYIENFCISHLLKLALVIVLLYFVLLFFYLSYKLGICQCICHTFCRSIWACFSVIECCFSFLCLNLQKHNQKRRMKRARRDIEELSISSDEEDCEGSTYSQAHRDIEIERRKRSRSRRGREYKEEYLRRALRPKNHRVRVRLSRGDSFDLKKKNSNKNGDYHICPVDHIRVSRTSKFAQKGGNFKASSSHRRK